MKLTLENSLRMVLTDHNYMAYIIGAVLSIIGLACVIFLLSNIVVLILGLVLVFLGIRMLVSTKMVTITLDKSTGKGNITLQGFIGSGSRDMELSKIRKMTLSKVIASSNRKTGERYKYIVNFVMDAGESPHFDLANVPGSIIDDIASPGKKEEKFVQQVADFLGVPMEFAGPPSLNQAISAINEG